MKYGLSEKQLDELLAIVKLHPEVEQVVLFGSRALGTYKEASDIDLTIKGSHVTDRTISRLKDAFEDSDLPFFVDVVNYQTIDNPKFKRHIDQQGVGLVGNVMSEWQEVTLDDVAIINPTEKIKKGQIAKKIAMEMLQPFTKKPSSFIEEKFNGGMKFKNGDTVVARITPCLENGKTAYIDFLDDGEVAYGSTEYIVIREKQGLSNSQFLYYFSISSIFRDVAILSMTGSSGRQRVQTDLIRNHLFDLPKLDEQKAIASVLSSLDDKIDLLHRQNKTLEAMAETIFRQWFVEEAKEDWESFGLLEIVKLVGGGTPKTSMDEYWEGQILWLAGGDIASNHKSFISDSEKKITETGLENSSAKLLPKYATVISARGTVGKYCLLARPMAFSQSNYGILPKRGEKFFFTYLLVNHVVEELQASAYGSVFDTITTSTFKEINKRLPHESEIAEFESSVTPYFEKMLKNNEQVQNLEKLRDTLLPKLISGKVRVA